MKQPDTLKQLPVSIVHRRIRHHAGNSGYSVLFEHLDLPQAKGGLRSWLALHLPKAIRWRLHLLRPQPVGDEGLLPELGAISTVANKTPGLVHFIYGEDTYFYTPLWQSGQKKVVATFHYPPQRLNERVNRAILKHLDAVLLMSESQRSWFEQYLPADKIHVLHHHVNTAFFTPSERQENTQETFRIISLGGILRDMDLLLRVVQSLTEKLGPEKIAFDFLIPPNKREPFKNLKNVTIHSRISDEELRDLYRNATLGFMPLEDCTANNAVLEMMACGKAVACSRAGGIEDYLTEEGALMFARDTDVDALTDNIIALLHDSQKRRDMGTHNRNRALEHFSFDATAAKLGDIYETILASEK